MKNKFIAKESFKHLMAKDLLHKWLCDEEKKSDICRLYPFNWRVNYGVFKELIFYEKSSPYYFEDSEEGHEFSKMLFVPDITIFHKGSAITLIEVVHQNHVSDEKLKKIINFFNGDIAVFEIDAEEILRQIEVPKKLKYRLLHSGSHSSPYGWSEEWME